MRIAMMVIFDSIEFYLYIKILFSDNSYKVFPIP